MVLLAGCGAPVDPGTGAPRPVTLVVRPAGTSWDAEAVGFAGASGVVIRSGVRFLATGTILSAAEARSIVGGQQDWYFDRCLELDAIVVARDDLRHDPTFAPPNTSTG